VKKKAYFYSTKITHTVTRLLDSNVFFFSKSSQSSHTHVCIILEPVLDCYAQFVSSSIMTWFSHMCKL
jgi:hypothetical protein